MTYIYEVEYAEDHQAMAESRYRTAFVSVQAESEPEANLIAASMVGHLGIPTRTTLATGNRPICRVLDK